MKRSRNRYWSESTWTNITPTWNLPNSAVHQADRPLTKRGSETFESPSDRTSRIWRSVFRGIAVSLTRHSPSRDMSRVRARTTRPSTETVALTSMVLRRSRRASGRGGGVLVSGRGPFFKDEPPRDRHQQGERSHVPSRTPAGPRAPRHAAVDVPPRQPPPGASPQPSETRRGAAAARKRA